MGFSKEGCRGVATRLLRSTAISGQTPERVSGMPKASEGGRSAIRVGGPEQKVRVEVFIGNYGVPRGSETGTRRANATAIVGARP